MENTITLTTGQKIEVLMQDEVTLDIDCSLRYIESGKKEIETYVEDISKQRLNSIVEDAKLQMDKQIEAGVVEAQEKAATSAKEIIDENISSMKSEIDNYINNDIKPEVENAKSEAIKSADAAVEAANSALSSYNGLKSSLELAQEVASGNIGDIKYTLRNTEPYGGVFCNGQILTEEQYPDLYQMLLDDRLEKVSLTEYESQVTLTGACNFFAIDEINQTIKVPTITSETPDKRAYVVCYTGKDIEIDITQEIALNNPFSLLDYKWSEYELSNASWLLSNGIFHSGMVYKAVYELLLKIHNGTQTKEGVSVKLSTEAYADTDFVINTADTTFRLPVKVKLASGNMIVGNGEYLGLERSKFSGTNYVIASNYADTTKGAYLYQNNTGANVAVTTNPTQSGIETSSSGLKLYFYVGETIQDANLISASGVFTALSNKVGFDDKETIIGWGMPDYSAGIALTSGSNPPQLGYVMFDGNDVQNDYALGYIDGVNVFRFGSSAYQVGETAGMYLVNELNTITTVKAKIKFYPLKGVN